MSYVIAVLVVAHFWLQMKIGHTTPLPYSIVLALLLASRLLAWRQGDRGAAIELKEG